MDFYLIILLFLLHFTYLTSNPIIDALTKMTWRHFGQFVLDEFFYHGTNIGFCFNDGHEGIRTNELTTDKHKFFRWNAEIARSH